MGLIVALELMTEADRSHFKVIAALLLLIFRQRDGYFIAGDYWQPKAAPFLCCSAAACQPGQLGNIVYTVRGQRPLMRRQTGLRSWAKL